jgi:2-keto-4-pentenoate hydratase
MPEQITPDGALEAILADARRTGKRVRAKDLVPPADLAAAAAAQARIYRSVAADVKGWKVGLRPDKLAVAAPLFPLHETPTDKASSVAAIPWRPGIAIEVEIAVRLAADLPVRADRLYQREDIAKAIASVHLGLEVVDDRVVEGSEAPLLIFLADALGNGGYVLGPQIPGRLAKELVGQNITILLSGESLFSAAAVHPNGDPLTPLLAYAQTPSDALGGLKAGQVITTGNLCGVLDVPRPGRIDVLFGDQPMLSVEFRDAMSGATRSDR